MQIRKTRSTFFISCVFGSFDTKAFSLAIFVAILVCLTAARSISGAPGELDTTFNGTGKTKIGFGETDDLIRGSVIQPDGKIVAAGFSDLDCSVARFNADGSLDLSFGTEGRTVTSVAIFDECAAVALQSDGKILVAGYTEIILIDFDFLILRYNTNGTLDTSFGTNGIVKTNFGQQTDRILSLAVQPDDKIVAVGYTENGNDVNFAVARYNPDGSPDTTFDTDGKTFTSFSEGEDYGVSVAVQPDGKIVAAGYAVENEFVDVALVRYNTDGSLDNSFGREGRVRTTVGKFGAYGYAVLVQPDGKLVVSGFADDGFAFNFMVVRYNPNGTLDSSFDGDGKVLTPVGVGDAFAFAAALQPDGKIIAAGRSSVDDFFDFTLVRYNPNGSLDTSFGNGGKVTNSVSEFFDLALSVLVQADGRILALGYAAVGFNADFTAIRYNSNGALDPTFDTDGIAIADIGDALAVARATTIQPDGKIIVAGYNFDGGGNRFAVARFNADGTPDLTFGTKGKVYTLLGFSSEANTVALQPDGKIILAGTNFDQSGVDFALVRYNPDGTLDASFGAGGRVIVTFGENADYINAVALQTDGKIVATGASFNGNDGDFAIARFNTDGSLDNSFDGDGRVILRLTDNDDVSFAISLQPDGKIIAGGMNSLTTVNLDFALVRLNADGSRDTSFDGDGLATTSFGLWQDSISALAVQSDGKIVAVGYRTANEIYDSAVVRYNANGSLDQTFGTGGKVVTQLSTEADYALSVAIQPDGRILTAGESFLTPSNSAFAAVRYNSDGSLDNSFAEKQVGAWGVGGVAIIDLSVGLDRAYNLKLDAFGRPVIVGSFDALFGVVRLQNEPLANSAGRVGGIVLNAQRKGIPRAVVTLRLPNGETRQAFTNFLGRFSFGSLPTGEIYTLSVRSKGFQFAPPTIFYAHFGDFEGIEFTGNR